MEFKRISIDTSKHTPLEHIRSINDLVTPLEHPEAILAQLWEENDCKLAPKISHVASLLEEIGRYHAGCPNEHLEQLADWRKNFSVKARYMQSNRCEVPTSRRGIFYWTLPPWVLVR